MEYQQLTHDIIGAAMEVHKILGNGFQEVIYQRALAIELANRDIPFSREHVMGFNIKVSTLVHAGSIFLWKKKLWWK